MLQANGIARVGEIAIGVGVDVGEQDLQRIAVRFALEVPFLAVGGAVQSALVIRA